MKITSHTQTNTQAHAYTRTKFKTGTISQKVFYRAYFGHTPYFHYINYFYYTTFNDITCTCCFNVHRSNVYDLTSCNAFHKHFGRNRKSKSKMFYQMNFIVNEIQIQLSTAKFKCDCNMDVYFSLNWLENVRNIETQRPNIYIAHFTCRLFESFVSLHFSCSLTFTFVLIN